MNLATVASGIIVALISVTGSWLVARGTNRTAQRTTERQVAAQVEVSRQQAEEQAFVRAKLFYESVIARQDAELAEQEAELRDLRSQFGELRGQFWAQDQRLAECRRLCRGLARRLGDPDPNIDDSV